jgi:glycosyltransferase involved in cell wall biosynthesis
MIKNISVVIIAKNADLTIKQTLESLSLFSEVIVYLNNSTDNTEKISSDFANVKIVKGEFIGFGPTKNQAAKYASNDWILSLDSDEIIPSALRKELESLDLSDPEKVYALKMDDYFLGYKLKFRTEKKVRLYNRTKHCFDDLKVHENIIYNPGDKIVLEYPFKHMHINTVNQTLEKTIRYSDLAAKGNKTCFFIVVIGKPIFAFFQAYILRLGFLNGWVGFAVAISNANDRYYKYLKRYVNCKKPEIDLP